MAVSAQANAVLPLATGGVSFTGFRDLSGSIDASCNNLFFALGSATCSGPVFYFGGNLGAGLHVTGEATGTGTTSAASAAPKATSQLNLSGGDASSGAGGNDVRTTLDYYVTVIPLGPPPLPTLRIPLDFTDAGSVNANASNSHFSVSVDAQTFVDAFLGVIVVDGTKGFISDDVSQTVDGGSISQSYGKSHSVVFDFSQGETVAEVQLLADCNGGSITAGAGTVDCFASADPFIGFDQSAFDALMGSNTFPLSNYFQIVLSPGLEGGVPASVPEPSSLIMLCTGLAGLCVIRRRRAARNRF